jgi:hypothetical protein
MRFFVLATDYDGTIAQHGRVTADTVSALRRLVDSGRRLLLVTGRELDDLLGVFPEIGLFEWVVAENGAVLYRPSDREERTLADPPPDGFVQALRQCGVSPMSVGRSIVATWEPHQTVILDTIRDQGLDLQVIFNKGAVMALPAGVNKASGLFAALKLMNVSQHETVGVGDAENDQAFLHHCEVSAAVSNALPSLKERVHLVTSGDHGTGVVELIDDLIANDLARYEAMLAVHDLPVGVDDAGRQVTIPAFGSSLLIAGPSGSGKSTTTTSLLERLTERQYQFCVIDPEGDYEALEFAVTIGTGDREPGIQEVVQVLHPPDQNVVVNLIGQKLSDRPDFFAKLLPQLLGQRGQLGRPHWLIVDEAHHLLPPSWKRGTTLAAEVDRAVYITVHPDQVHPDILKSVAMVIAVGPRPAETLRAFCEAQHEPPPALDLAEPQGGEVYVWSRRSGTSPRRVRIVPTATERRRHIRKYSEGELPPERSFYFRGPEGKLNLRAHNLIVFLQLADGVDDDTWTHHLDQGDYSRWVRTCIKDDVLANEIAAIGRNLGAPPAETRRQVREAIERRYTLPASASRAAPDQQVREAGRP